MTEPIEVLFKDGRVVRFNHAQDFVFNYENRYVKIIADDGNNIFVNFDHVLYVGAQDSI